MVVLIVPATFVAGARGVAVCQIVRQTLFDSVPRRLKVYDRIDWVAPALYA